MAEVPSTDPSSSSVAGPSTGAPGPAPPAPATVGAVAFVVVVVCLGAVGTALLNDGDTYWHIATGELVLDTGRVPRTDPFSYTAAGEPWIAKEWLSQVLLAATWRVAGWAGVVALSATAAAAAFGLLAAVLARRATVRTVVVVVAIAVAVIIVVTR